MAPRQPAADPTSDPTTAAIADAINPGAPEEFTSKAIADAQAFGVLPHEFYVKVFRAAPASPGIPGIFVGKFNFTEFSEDAVATKYGAGSFVCQLHTTNGRAAGTRRTCRFEIGEEAAGSAPRLNAAQQPSTSTVAAQPAQPASGMSLMETLIVKSMDQNTQILTAILSRERPEPDRWWVPLVAPLLPDFAKKIMGGGGGGFGIGQVREFLDFIEERKEEREEGTSWMNFAKELLPMFLQQLGAQQPNAAGAVEPTGQTSARGTLPPRQNTPPQGASTPQQPKSLPAQGTARVDQPSATTANADAGSGAAEEKRDAAELSMQDFLGSALGLIRTACACQQPDVESYANILADMMEAHSVDTKLIDATELGMIADMLIVHAPDLRMFRPILVDIESAVRDLYKPETPADVPGQLTIGATTPETPTDPPAELSPAQKAARTRAANKAAREAAASKEAKP